MAVKKIQKNVYSIIIGILITIGGWALFSLMRISSERILINYFGITDEFNQALILVLFVFAMLVILGYGFQKTLKSLKLL